LDSTTTLVAAPPAGRLSALADIAIWFGVLLAWILVIGLFGRALAANPALMWLGAPVQALVFLGVAMVLLRRRGEGWRTVGLAPPVSIRRVAGLVVGGYAAMIAMNATLVLAVFPALGVAPPRLGAFLGITGHPWIFVSWLALAWSSAAVGEELLFRGFLWSRLERLFGGARRAPVPTLVAQAALFGLAHIYQGWGGVLVTGAIGLVLGGVFLAGRRNLVACMVLHGLVDTVSLTAVFLGILPTGAAP